MLLQFQLPVVEKESMGPTSFRGGVPAALPICELIFLKFLAGNQSERRNALMLVSFAGCGRRQAS